VSLRTAAKRYNSKKYKVDTWVPKQEGSCAMGELIMRATKRR
jgi:hypothetical protein